MERRLRLDGERGGIRGEFRNRRQQVGLARGRLFGELPIRTHRRLATGRHGFRKRPVDSDGSGAATATGDKNRGAFGLGELQSAPEQLSVLENSQTAFIDYSGLLAML